MTGSYSKQRNMTRIAGAAVTVALLALLIVAQGCGNGEDTSDTVTSSATTALPFSGTEITSLSVDQETVTDGSPITFTVMVKGPAVDVTINDELQPSATAGPNTPNFTEPMAKGDTSDDVTTWTLETAASQEGTHRFYAEATLEDGSKIVSIERPTYTVTAP